MAALPETLALPSKKILSAIEIARTLKAIIDNWETPGIPFHSYLIFAALTENIQQDVAGKVLGNQGVPLLIAPFPGTRIGITFQSIQKLLQDTSSNPIFSKDATKTVFVIAEGIDPIPYESMIVLSNAFVSGLATRLLLESYKAAWNAAGFSVGDFSIGMANTLGLSQAVKNLSAATRTPKNWSGMTGAPTYEQYLIAMMDSCSSQAAGLILGWIAGDSIASIPEDGNKRKNCIAAVWRLIGSRYTTFELGAAVSYTLSYLTGFVRNERTVAIFSGASSTPAPISDVRQIIVNLSNHLGDDKEDLDSSLSALSSRLFDMIEDEFYVIFRKNIVDPKVLTFYLENHRAFLLGFQRGNALAAELLFQKTFSVGFNIGYARGFRDGYSQGYAAGWQAGYEKGEKDGKAAAKGISEILKDISDVVKDADKFVKDVKQAGEVVVSIAALF